MSWSFDDDWRGGQRIKPRILVLEVRSPGRTDEEAIGWVLVERKETYGYGPDNRTVYEASICLSYQRITAKGAQQDKRNGAFNGGYWQSFNAVSLTSTSMSSGAVYLGLPGLEGHRIGTYLMNEIVQWAQQWPEATVNSVKLLAGQADRDNKERRNQFYEQFGLIFDYTDPDHREGCSRSILAGALNTVEPWKLENITEHRMFDYLAAVLYEKDCASSELVFRDRACKDLHSELKRAEKHPIRWMFRQLLRRFGIARIWAWGG